MRSVMRRCTLQRPPYWSVVYIGLIVVVLGVSVAGCADGQTVTTEKSVLPAVGAVQEPTQAEITAVAEEAAMPVLTYSASQLGNVGTITGYKCTEMTETEFENYLKSGEDWDVVASAMDDMRSAEPIGFYKVEALTDGQAQLGGELVVVFFDNDRLSAENARVYIQRQTQP